MLVFIITRKLVELRDDFWYYIYIQTSFLKYIGIFNLISFKFYLFDFTISSIPE